MPNARCRFALGVAKSVALQGPLLLGSIVIGKRFVNKRIGADIGRPSASRGYSLKASGTIKGIACLLCTTKSSGYPPPLSIACKRSRTDDADNRRAGRLHIERSKMISLERE
jgi:hypothetical protein